MPAVLHAHWLWPATARGPWPPARCMVYHTGADMQTGPRPNSCIRRRRRCTMHTNRCARLSTGRPSACSMVIAYLTAITHLLAPAYLLASPACWPSHAFWSPPTRWPCPARWPSPSCWPPPRASHDLAG
eukprot:366331-Chlamydomonas_euryale.AAC.7